MTTYPRPENGSTLERVVAWGQQLVVVLTRADALSKTLALEYTVDTLPSAKGLGGRSVLVSDETGGATLAFSDGTSWRRVQDRAVVS